MTSSFQESLWQQGNCQCKSEESHSDPQRSHTFDSPAPFHLLQLNKIVNKGQKLSLCLPKETLMTIPIHTYTAAFVLHWKASLQWRGSLEPSPAFSIQLVFIVITFFDHCEIESPIQYKALIYNIFFKKQQNQYKIFLKSTICPMNYDV